MSQGRKHKLKEPISAYWYQALHSPYGVELIASDLDQVRQKLYVERKKLLDPALDSISVCQSPFDPSKIWLVKRKKTNETP